MRRLFLWFKTRFQTFDLLPDYFRAVVRQWHEILWGASLAAVAFVLWWFLGNPSPTIIAYYLVAVLAVAGYFVWRSERIRLIPGIKIRGVKLQTTPVTRTWEGRVDGLARERRIDTRTLVQIEIECLSENPVYECRGYLQRARRWSDEKNEWEASELRSLVLVWDNELTQEITQHRGVEKPLNIICIQHSDGQIVPWVFGDIPMARFREFFSKEYKRYEFDVLFTSSERAGGELRSIKPVSACVRVQVRDDPSYPNVDVLPKSA